VLLCQKPDFGQEVWRISWSLIQASDYQFAWDGMLVTIRILQLVGDDGGRVVGLAGVSALVRRLERHRRSPDVGDALFGVDRHALGTVHRLFRRPRELRLAADDAAVLGATAAAAAAAARRGAGVVQLVLVVERLQ